MNELEERKPRTRDDSRVRALALAAKARRELKLPAKAIDWKKLFATVAAAYAQGRTEGDINWKQVVADSRLPMEASGTLKLAPVFAVVVVTLGLFVFTWNRQGEGYRVLDRQLEILTVTVETLKQQNASLQQENEALRKQVSEAVALNKQTQTALEQQVAQFQQENETLKQWITQRTPQPRLLVALQDKEGVVTVETSGTVRLGQDTLPAPFSQSVFDLVTLGEVTPTKPVSVAMAELRADATRGELRSTRSGEQKKPVPESPVLTAVRSTTPTLRWEALPGAEEYKMIVADKADQMVWGGSAGTQTQVTVPSDVLQRGQVYFWQVEAQVEGESRRSPIVGFWVIDIKSLREVEAVEQSYPNSESVLAGVYQRHGLYEDALVQLEQLADRNQNNPFAQVMLANLRRQLGREER